MPWLPPSISEIVPHLFIGNLSSSMNLDTLRENNINAIVSLLDGPYAKWNEPENRKLVPKERHLFVPCLDSSTMDVLALMSDVCDFIDKHLHTPIFPLLPEEGAQNDSHNGIGEETPSTGNVLVHCKVGVSRSGTFVLAYLMRKRHDDLDSVLNEVKGKRNIKPNYNFLEQLKVWEVVEYQVWKDPIRNIPKEPYRAYLNRRAARLATKGLTGNEPTVMTSL
ncbi:protein-tyrosine phosphatase-like protein [Ilyonectria robusta]|uniref:protein-tyrosine phosphatase-like protein n=1 Tax=Ilyonectria robusta TaxID=1079257 RepID=UPI001E8EB5FC|nr:protein-tyrosine phosphatase-like protein [Ilyonectria robusta]KAH8714450.1 protein-tyrosine phosphatase-like protein [Ilyonectria robusta]